jgi:conjugative transfer region protein TrbK
MRGRFFTPLGRALAILLLVAAVIASLVVTSHHPRSVPTARPAGGDPVRAQLDRCRGLGVDAGRDPACQAAWRRLRDHFFGQPGAEGRP